MYPAITVMGTEDTGVKADKVPAPWRLYIIMGERPLRRKWAIKVASQSSNAIKNKVTHDAESVWERGAYA